MYIVDRSAPPNAILVGRLSRIGDNEAEFALLVSDAWQGRGLGSNLLKHLIDVARLEKLAHVSADVLPNNTHMQRLCERAGLRTAPSAAQDVVHAWIELNQNPPL